MNNEELKVGTEAQQSTTADGSFFSQTIAKPLVIGLLKAFMEHYNKQHYEEISMSDIDDFLSL
jgi:hypothetical protein